MNTNADSVASAIEPVTNMGTSFGPTTLYYYGPETTDCAEASRHPVIPNSILELYEKASNDINEVIKYHEETMSCVSGFNNYRSLSISFFETNSCTFHYLQDCFVSLGCCKEALVIAELSRT